MPQRNYAVDKSQASAAPSTLDNSNYSAREKLTRAIPLRTALVFYTTIEFLAVATSAYFASALYHSISFNSLPRKQEYIFAAVLIAMLVLFISIAFRNFVSLRRQSRHKFLWRGIGAVLLAFSVFVTMLVFTQSAEAYSRGSLVFQIISVALTVTCTRAIFSSWLQTAIASNQIEARRVALVGEASQCSKFGSRLKSSGVQTICSFRLPVSHNLKNTVVTDGTAREIVSQLRSLRADDIIVLATSDVMPTIFDFTASLSELPLGVHIVPVDALNTLASLQIGEFDSLQTIQVYRPPLSIFELCIKAGIRFYSGASRSNSALAPIFDRFNSHQV